MLNTTLDLQSFFPEDLELNSIEQSEQCITLKLRSKTKSCTCMKCNQESIQYHGTYTRTVQDLSLLGKTVYLEITAHEYTCTNPLCDATTVVEDFDGFLSYYGRLTERCADFICALALETSCEASARICKAMNIQTSGDTVIRLLTKRYKQQPEPQCGDTICVDDFAFKKRHTYGTIIVVEATHNTVAVLDGRDGKALKEWLKNNKHVKTVTRDRASAYEKVIAEELPDAIQIADRFHLHQNLLEAIRKAIGREIPATITIKKEPETPAAIEEEPESITPPPSQEMTDSCVDKNKNPRTHCG